MKKVSEKLGHKEPIKGFKVMEWLRGVRDANYELSIKDPEEYRRKEEKARKRLDLLDRRARRRAKNSRSKQPNETTTYTLHFPRD